MSCVLKGVVLCYFHISGGLSLYDSFDLWMQQAGLDVAVYYAYEIKDDNTIAAVNGWYTPHDALQKLLEQNSIGFHNISGGYGLFRGNSRDAKCKQQEHIQLCYYDIPAGISLDDAYELLNTQTQKTYNLTFDFPPKGIKASGVKGWYTFSYALWQMLRGTGLEFETTNDKTFVVNKREPIPETSDEPVTPYINVPVADWK